MRARKAPGRLESRVGRSSRSERRTSPASGELEKKIAESLEKSSELRKDSELQSTQRKLRKARQLVEIAKAERDHKRAAFQVEKEGLLCDLKQAHADKVEAEKKAGDFKAKVHKEIQVYKRFKYEQGYKDRA